MSEPGWYTDPEGSGHRKYIDGRAWSEPAPFALPPDAAPLAGRRLFFAIIAASTLIPTGVLLYECVTDLSFKSSLSVLLCVWGNWVILQVLIRLYGGDTMADALRSVMRPQG